MHRRLKGTPSPKLAVAGTGVILLVGGLSMSLRVYPVVGIILLIIFRQSSRAVGGSAVIVAGALGCRGRPKGWM